MGARVRTASHKHSGKQRTTMDGSRRDIPDGLERRFWKLVLLLNVAPIALAFGVLLAVFHGTSRFVWASLAVSAVAFVSATRTYLTARRQLREVAE